MAWSLDSSRCALFLLLSYERSCLQRTKSVKLSTMRGVVSSIPRKSEISSVSRSLLGEGADKSGDDGDDAPFFFYTL